jgi:predicted RNA binding protein YcfA (HicA-like mRNA interferase family)
MSKEEKLISRLLSLPKDFTFDELSTLLRRLGFDASNKGATSGSRVAFTHKETETLILVHKPHPRKEIRISALKEVLRILKEKNFI